MVISCLVCYRTTSCYLSDVSKFDTAITRFDGRKRNLFNFIIQNLCNICLQNMTLHNSEKNRRINDNHILLYNLR